MTRESINVKHGDVSPEFEWAALDARLIAWDIETSGLDWGSERIATCQLHVPGFGTEVVRINAERRPERMMKLLETQRVTKLFHHAAFDLRFMAHHWNVRPSSVACTKVLAKIVHPGLDRKQYSLAPLVGKYLGVHLDKSQQVSDWFVQTLSEEQLRYAVGDVLHLLPLYEALRDEAESRGLLDFVDHSFEYLPTRVATDLRGCGDVFSY